MKGIYAFSLLVIMTAQLSLADTNSVEIEIFGEDVSFPASMEITYATIYPRLSGMALSHLCSAYDIEVSEEELAHRFQIYLENYDRSQFVSAQAIARAISRLGGDGDSDRIYEEELAPLGYPRQQWDGIVNLHESGCDISGIPEGLIQSEEDLFELVRPLLTAELLQDRLAEFILPDGEALDACIQQFQMGAERALGRGLNRETTVHVVRLATVNNYIKMTILTNLHFEDPVFSGVLTEMRNDIHGFEDILQLAIQNEGGIRR